MPPKAPRDQLQELMHGPVLAPEDPAYGPARRIWNGAIDRKPALIARCRATSDVLAAVHGMRCLRKAGFPPPFSFLFPDVPITGPQV